MSSREEYLRKLLEEAHPCEVKCDEDEMEGDGSSK